MSPHNIKRENLGTVFRYYSLSSLLIFNHVAT